MLTSLYQHDSSDGPFVSIYLATDGAVENAAQKIELRWKDALRELAEAGVDEATREALTTALGAEPHRQGGTRVLIAASGSADPVRLAISLPDPPAAEVVRVAPLPYLLPLVDWAQTRVPHVVVLADRRGADILAYTDAAEPDISASVDTSRFPDHKTGIGGWSAQRYEHKVEEDWKASAKDAAAAVERAAQQIGAQLIVASGDTYAVDGIRDHLPTAMQPLYRIIEGGGRSEDGSDAVVAERVLQQLGDKIASDTIDLLADFAKYRNRAVKQRHSPEFGGGQPDVAANAADGPAETVAALRMAQVGTLLLSDLLHEDDAAYFGPEPTHLALNPEELRDMGVGDPRRGSLVDVLVRAALGTDAQIRLVPGDTEDSPKEGVGALLRYSNEPTPDNT
jgi:hypothetical protein